MEQNSRHNGKHLQRNITRSEEKEKHSETRPRQTNTTTKETKHQRRFKRTITHISNLRKYKLTPGEISLLSKGLNFIPTPKKEHPAKLLQDILLFDRRLRLKYFFIKIKPIHNQLNKTTQHYPSSGWTPSSGQDPFLESYRSKIIQNTLKEIKKKSNKHFKGNLKKEERTAITTLRNNKNIVIKPADKGGNIVIMDREDYLEEGLTQLSDHNHYELLEEGPTQNDNNKIYQVLQQAANLEIIDDKMKKNIIQQNTQDPKLLYATQNT